MRRHLFALVASLSLSGALNAQQASWTTAPTLPSEGHYSRPCKEEGPAPGQFPKGPILGS